MADHRYEYFGNKNETVSGNRAAKCILQFTDKNAKIISGNGSDNTSGGWMLVAKIWIDNLRTAPEGYLWCKSVNEAKDHIS